MDDMLIFAQRILASQPFSVLLGAQVTAFSHTGVEIRVPLRPELLQQNGFAHGGVLSYLADNALTFAGGAALGPNVLTGGFTISYVRPARGEVLIARASVVAAGKRQATCRCDLFALMEEKETLCAVAQGTIATIGD